MSRLRGKRNKLGERSGEKNNGRRWVLSGTEKEMGENNDAEVEGDGRE